MKRTKEDKIFKAIADSKRRDILKMLVVASVALNINFISSKFTESRQGITKHIKVLVDAGLVNIERKGRETFCYANPEGLKIIDEWLKMYRKFWQSKLDDLDDYLAST